MTEGSRLATSVSPSRMASAMLMVRSAVIAETLSGIDGTRRGGGIGERRGLGKGERLGDLRSNLGRETLRGTRAERTRLLEGAPVARDRVKGAPGLELFGRAVAEIVVV